MRFAWKVWNLSSAWGMRSVAMCRPLWWEDRLGGESLLSPFCPPIGRHRTRLREAGRFLGCIVGWAATPLLQGKSEETPIVGVAGEAGGVSEWAGGISSW